jgi:hypothetical protein
VANVPTHTVVFLSGFLEESPPGSSRSKGLGVSSQLQRHFRSSGWAALLSELE